ncbi:MAG: hypothetical protein GY835_19890, partial [bacterium]|nr:hypothetical protein [bacterium]
MQAQNGAGDAAAQAAAAQAAITAAQNAAMVAAMQFNMAQNPSNPNRVGFPPFAAAQGQRLGAASTPPTAQNLQQMQLGAPQMQFGQMPQALTMPGFYPANPFAQQQMTSPFMQFPFHTMAPFYQQALAQQAMGQMGGWGPQPQGAPRPQMVPPAPPAPPSSNSSGNSHQSAGAGSSGQSDRDRADPPRLPARPSSELSDVSDAERDRSPSPTPATEPAEILKSALEKIKAAPSASAKDTKKLKRVPVPDETHMDWQRHSTNRIIFRDLVSVANAVNKFRKYHLEEEGTLERAKDFNRIGDKVQRFFDHINIAET